MLELLQASIAGPNILLTVMLALCLFYWLTVIFGAIDADSLDVDLDVDVDVDIDVDVDVDVDVDADLDVDADADVETEGGVAGAGWFLGLLRFFNFGSVPFMVALSVLILCMWSISVWCNHEGSLVNPTNSPAIAAALFFPNMLVSAFLMKFLTMPLVPIFAKLNTAAKQADYTGKTGTLTISAGKDKMGQAKLFVDGAVVLLNVKTSDNQPLKRGERILIVDEIPDEKYFIIERMDEH